MTLFFTNTNFFLKNAMFRKKKMNTDNDAALQQVNQWAVKGDGLCPSMNQSSSSTYHKTLTALQPHPR